MGRTQCTEQREARDRSDWGGDLRCKLTCVEGESFCRFHHPDPDRRARISRTPILTVNHRRALRAYAEEHGSAWKGALLHDWHSGISEGYLRQLRNTRGPAWLKTFTLTIP